MEKCLALTVGVFPLFSRGHVAGVRTERARWLGPGRWRRGPLLLSLSRSIRGRQWSPFIESCVSCPGEEGADSREKGVTQ